MGSGFRYDIELLLSDIKSIFQGNFNAQIDLINNEKQNITTETKDNFAINRINTDAWYLNHVPTVWSYPQFVVWGIDDISIKAPQPDCAIQQVKIFIEVAIPDDGSPYNESVIYKLLRYSRALQDIAMKNYDKIRGYGKIQVDSLSPALVSIGDKSLRISGIIITASIGLR